MHHTVRLIEVTVITMETNRWPQIHSNTRNTKHPKEFRHVGSGPRFSRWATKIKSTGCLRFKHWEQGHLWNARTSHPVLVSSKGYLRLKQQFDKYANSLFCRELDKEVDNTLESWRHWAVGRRPADTPISYSAGQEIVTWNLLTFCRYNSVHVFSEL